MTSRDHTICSGSSCSSKSRKIGAGAQLKVELQLVVVAVVEDDVVDDLYRVDFNTASAANCFCHFTFFSVHPNNKITNTETITFYIVLSYFLM